MTHDEYIKKYPNYCRECNGTGIHECYDSVPYGSTNVSMDTSEPCVCTEQGCPRCSDPAIWDDSIDDFVTCPECGWDYYSAVDFGCPRKPP